MPNILAIDDVPEFLSEIKSILRGQFTTITCQSPIRGIRRALREAPDLIITTLVMKELNGLEVIRRIRGEGCKIPILMVTSYGDPQTASEAIRIGANDYIHRPINPDELIGRVQKAYETTSPAITPLASLENGIYTRDPEMLNSLELARTVANTDSRILILGETGCGKELFARAIHRYSQRSSHAFVEINCAAIPENLLESELFGHEKGAFTGALQRRIGRFEEAGEGTLFLDEIGEINLNLQSKLLRVMQNGDYSRVGGQKTLKSSARIVAATNRNLREEVEKGNFRADLYFRINVVPLNLPPLRKRPADVSLLADHFIEKFHLSDKPQQHFSESAIKVMQAYDWPGNVRELEHLVERLCIVNRSNVFEVSDLPPHMLESNRFETEQASEASTEIPPYSQARYNFDKHYIDRLLAQTNGNYSAAAKIAQMERSQFFRMAKKHLA
jgi:DNA-binding NtrC family response regulator